MYRYVYQITNLLNDMIYVGKRTEETKLKISETMKERNKMQRLIEKKPKKPGKSKAIRIGSFNKKIPAERTQRRANARRK